MSTTNLNAEVQQHEHTDRILVLEVVCQDAARRKLWLRPGQVVHFGRTHRADESFPHDAGMSSRHFLVERTGEGWCCRDLQSTNGTFVNDVLVAEAILHPGDRIRAGNTLFMVVPTHGSSVTQLSAPTQILDRASPNASTLRQPKPGELAYRAHSTPSGLHLFVGQKSNTDPAFVLQVLSKKSLPLILSDKDDALRDCAGGKMVALLDGKRSESDESARVIVQSPSRQAVSALVEARWGRDELVSFAGMSKTDHAVESIRSLAKSTTEQFRAGPLSELRPAALSEFILNRATALDGLMSAMEYLFLEVFQGDRWGIITLPDREAGLQQLGFHVADPWQ
jgi:pSer/pThr/pTyr-binding forkhead associated (FHA) protein